MPETEDPPDSDAFGFQRDHHGVEVRYRKADGRVARPSLGDFGSPDVKADQQTRTL